MTDQISRDVLPIPDTPFEGTLPYDVKDSAFAAIEPLRPPADAPNVLVILLDDVGFGASSAFGGPCATPTAERLAADGLKYNRFHTTALCAPTRLPAAGPQPPQRGDGRDHGARHVRARVQLDPAEYVRAARPDPEAQRLLDRAIRQMPRGAGLGDEPDGPVRPWPTGGGGFEHFYGFIGGETNQYYPAIYEGTTPVEPETTPEEGYHFTEDMTDKAIKWVRQQKSLMPDKPFFMYFAPGATHAPHHVPAEWSDKYKGRSIRAGMRCARRS